MQSSNNPQVVVLGVGNTLMQDDGVGVHVVHELAQAGSLPKNVRLVDAGVAGAGWLQLLEGVEHLLIVDAVRGTEPPGSLYRMTLGALKTRNGPTLSAHEVGVIEVLAMAELIDIRPQVLIVGVQPAVTDAPGLELTAELKDALPTIVAAVIDELQALGVAMPQRNRMTLVEDRAADDDDS